MAVKKEIRHVITADPVGLAVGDEWFNPSDNKLYKRLAVNGTVVTDNEIITSLSKTTLANNVTTADASNLILSTNNNIDSGNITITAGTNGNIIISPQGAGVVLLPANRLVLTANVASSSTSTGTLVVTGGIGVSGQVTATTFSGNHSGGSGAFTTLSSNAATTFTANTASSTTATGALVVTGGVGIGGNLNVGGNVVFTGTLTVNGTTTTINSTITTIDDPIFTLGGDVAPVADDNKDRGIEFRWHNGTTAKVGFFGFDDSTGKFTFIPDATNTSEVFSGTQGIITADDLQIKDYSVNASMWSRSFALMGA